jgi:hypothetical protein
MTRNLKTVLGHAQETAVVQQTLRLRTVSADVGSGGLFVLGVPAVQWNQSCFKERYGNAPEFFALPYCTCLPSSKQSPARAYQQTNSTPPCQGRLAEKFYEQHRRMQTNNHAPRGVQPCDPSVETVHDHVCSVHRATAMGTPPVLTKKCDTMKYRQEWNERSVSEQIHSYIALQPDLEAHKNTQSLFTIHHVRTGTSSFVSLSSFVVSHLT